MKLFQRITLIFILLLSFSQAYGQITYQAGAPLKIDEDRRLNQILGSDQTGFYCYRVRYKGQGTDYFVEKYDNNKQNLLFEKQLEFGDLEYVKIENVIHLQDGIYVFFRTYEKAKRKIHLWCTTIQPNGTMSKMKEVLALPARFLEFTHFRIYNNPAELKFLVKLCQKQTDQMEDPFESSFYLINKTTFATEWVKKVDQQLLKEDESLRFIPLQRLLGLYFDDNNDIYYATSSFTKKSPEGMQFYNLSLNCLKAAEDKPLALPLEMEESMRIPDVKFAKQNNQLFVLGFYKNLIEKPGRDFTQCGVFNFTVSLPDYKLESKSCSDFNPQLSAKLDLTYSHSKHYKYTVDQILKLGTSTYLIGQQYNTMEYYGQNKSILKSNYMDIIVAKLNSKGEFEWITNLPFRKKMFDLHISKQYIAYALNDNLYIMYNESPGNAKKISKKDYNPSSLDLPKKEKGTNFTFHAISMKDGSLKSGIIFQNKKYCFTPIFEPNVDFYPPEDSQLFCPMSDSSNEIIIYTEKSGQGQFGKIKIH